MLLQPHLPSSVPEHLGIFAIHMGLMEAEYIQVNLSDLKDFILFDDKVLLSNPSVENVSTTINTTLSPPDVPFFNP